MTAHALMLAGECLLAVSLVSFVIALVEQARDHRAVNIPVRKEQRQ